MLWERSNPRELSIITIFSRWIWWEICIKKPDSLPFYFLFSVMGLFNGKDFNMLRQDRQENQWWLNFIQLLWFQGLAIVHAGSLSHCLNLNVGLFWLADWALVNLHAVKGSPSPRWAREAAGPHRPVIRRALHFTVAFCRKMFFSFKFLQFDMVRCCIYMMQI